jgi:apolipoprotein N-acyltransferase
MIQIADIGGVFLVSAVVVAVNAFLFDCIWQFPEVRGWFGQSDLEPYRYYASWDLCNRGVLAECLFRRNLILEGGVLALILVCTYCYGAYRLGQDRFPDGPTVCLLQSNLDQRLRNETTAPEADGHSVKTVDEHFDRLCWRASRNIHPAPDLIIWPETSSPCPWYQVSTKLPNEKVPAEWCNAEVATRDWLHAKVTKHGRIPHLIGINGNELDENAKHRRYNSALLLDGQGKVETRFDKIHRVPFGEFIPFKDWLPFMNVFSAYDYDFSIQAGDAYTRFPLHKYHFGVLICFEDTDPFMARRYVMESNDGPGVDFLVNISNDGWFNGSCEHEEHLAVSRFRAIECRRAMVRSVNMGVSAVIDGNGRVLKPTLYPRTEPPVWVVQPEVGSIPDFAVSDWHTLKKTECIIKASVPIDTRFSLYVVAGDWLPIGCWAALLGGAAWALWRRRTAVRTV